MTLKQATAARRTFAIISHPDAGKTTLTENLLLLGGAIHLAGEVKARGERRRARSDWMKIEQQRGISVTTAVMTFEREGKTFNLLDTPGHEDFSEDTYRTLTAADSAIMVIDAAKGIEIQTLKLFEVCRLRNIPIITFINKIDREGLDPFGLMDEIAEKLALDTVPMNWPFGMGNRLKGVADFHSDQFLPYVGSNAKDIDTEPVKLDAQTLKAYMSETEFDEMSGESQLAKEAYPNFDPASFQEGHMTPVYFGSALRNFGVEKLLSAVSSYAPSPRDQVAQTRTVKPDEDRVSGFIFKVQANMDPNHRDRIAFMRLCSGRFRRGMKLEQSGTGKVIGVHNPILFFAQNRELAEEAWPGDIIGIPNHGVLRVGDTLSETGGVRFTGIPNFAPEILRRVRLGDPMKTKHMRRALESLAEEGVTQVFRPMIGANWIIGVVGQLQLEVLVNRMDAEYGIKVELEPAPYAAARWIAAATDEDLKSFEASNRHSLATDVDDNPVFLGKNDWEIGYVAEKWPDISFHNTHERMA